MLAVSSFTTRSVEISCPAGALTEDGFVGIFQLQATLSRTEPTRHRRNMVSPQLAAQYTFK